jgi:hypothetical protein
MATASYPTASTGNTNYARVCRVVVDVFRDVLWDLLTREIPASQIPNEVRRHLKSKNPPLRLFPQERLILCPPGGVVPREDCDTSLLYRLLRGICPSLPPPSKGWGNVPDVTDVTVGDDVERIRQMRNELYGHVTSAELSDADFHRHWQMMKGSYTNHLNLKIKTDLLLLMQDLHVQNRKSLFGHILNRSIYTPVLVIYKLVHAFLAKQLFIKVYFLDSVLTCQ